MRMMTSSRRGAGTRVCWRTAVRKVSQPVGDRRAVQQHLVEVQHAAAAGDDALDERLQRGRAEIGIRKSGHRRLLVCCRACGGRPAIRS